jgi:hypothetical protein
MIKAKVVNEEIIVDGELEPGEIIPSRCCPGFDWEVSIVFPDSNPLHIDVWGVCQNPDCPDYDKALGAEEDMYRGVSHVEVADLVEWMIANDSLTHGLQQPR